MQISSRFTIAVHMLVCMDTFKSTNKITSDFMAKSINVNPVIIRNILSNLKEAKIIDVKRGTGGASIIKPLEEITLLDVYRAIGCMEENNLFHFPKNPNKECPVGRNIHGILDESLHQTQRVMEAELGKFTVLDMTNNLAKLLAEENDQ